MSSYSIITVPFEKLDPYRGAITARWRDTLKFGNDMMKLTKMSTYKRAYTKHIANILDQPSSEVRLAVLTEDHDVVLGFSVSRGHVLDYVHVMHEYKRNGIGTRLVPKGITTVSHLTHIGLTIMAKKYPEWEIDLFA